MAKDKRDIANFNYKVHIYPYKRNDWFNSCSKVTRYFSQFDDSHEVSRHSVRLKINYFQNKDYINRTSCLTEPLQFQCHQGHSSSCIQYNRKNISNGSIIINYVDKVIRIFYSDIKIISNSFLLDNFVKYREKIDQK